MSAQQHDPDPETSIRLRLYIAGELRDEAWLDPTRPDAEEHTDATAARHRKMAEDAEAAGQRWLLEAYDPAWPEHDPAAKMYYGTDRDRMTMPVEMPPEELAELLRGLPDPPPQRHDGTEHTSGG